MWYCITLKGQDKCLSFSLCWWWSLWCWRPWNSTKSCRFFSFWPASEIAQSCRNVHSDVKWGEPRFDVSVFVLPVCWHRLPLSYSTVYLSYTFFPFSCLLPIGRPPSPLPIFPSSFLFGSYLRLHSLTLFPSLLLFLCSRHLSRLLKKKKENKKSYDTVNPAATYVTNNGHSAGSQRPCEELATCVSMNIVSSTMEGTNGCLSPFNVTLTNECVILQWACLGNSLVRI